MARRAAASKTANPFGGISGEMAARIGTHDWASTPLGPLEGWSPALLHTLRLLLPARAEIALFWGPDYRAFYNDAYAPTIGDKHPRALGQPARENWAELWSDLERLLDGVFRTGETFAAKNRPFYIERHGFGETVYFDVSYSAVREADGSIGGVLCIVAETTEQARANAALRRSEERLRLATESADVGLWDIDIDENISFFYARDAFSMPQDRKTSFEEFLSHVHPEDAAALRAGYAAARDPTQRASIEAEYRTLPIGNIPARWIAVKGRAIFDDAGRCIRLSGTAIDFTQRKQAELALSQREEQLRLATEHAEIGLWDVDNVTNTLYWPPRVKAMFGISADKPVTMADDFYAGLHPDDRDRVSAAYAAASDPTTRALYDVEYRTIGKEDGITRWVHAKGRGVFDETGRCVRVIGTAIDITRQRESAEALRESEEKLRLATDNAEIGLWDMDVVNDTNHPDSRVKAMFGLPSGAEQSVDEYFTQIHPDDVQRVVAAYGAALDPQKRAIYDVEYRVLGKDGVTRWVAAKGRGLFDGNNRCVRVIGTAIDVTRDREIAEALRRSEEQLRLATEFAEVGLWDMDVREDRLYWPPRVNQMFGLPPKAAITPKQFRALLHPDDRRRVIAAGLASCDPQIRTPYDIEYRIVRGDDGQVRWMAARGRASFAEDGTCLRMLGVIVDITRRKEVELQVHELNETLERRVAERTAALEKSEAQIRLAEQALQQAQKMEAIGNLTGGIAHDFNNLLQGVAGSLDLIRRKPDDVERVRRWADAGLQAAERGAKLTGQLLAFSRSQKLELRPIDLVGLLSGMHDLLHRTLEHNVTIHFDLDPDAGNVTGDETQIELAVLNLAINARDAMPEGGTLYVATRRHSAGDDPDLAVGDYVELTVRDTGVGMTPEVATRAFDPFFTTKGVGKGTGLGLSQVYGMARQAGGSARIKSAPGIGTTISIFLPRTDAATQPDATRVSVTETHGSAATVLVIDDDADVRAFLADSLDSLGFAVVEAEDGPAGLEAITRTRPDLVILDYAMPGMTGAEVAEKIRADTKDLPILFASGYADTSALDRVTENAIVLRKPFGVDELQRAVHAALGR